MKKNNNKKKFTVIDSINRFLTIHISHSNILKQNENENKKKTKKEMGKKLQKKQLAEYN